MVKISLGKGKKWRLYYHAAHMEVNEPDDLIKMNIPHIAATVPGNAELDLSAGRLLPEDLFKGENILAAEKYEAYDWWYETAFDLPAGFAGKKTHFIFHGVDCFAEYWLNGHKIGSSSNALIEHTFEAGGLLKNKGSNKLLVKISSAAKKAFEKPYNLYNGHTTWVSPEMLYVRKPPHAFGWDIMPRAVSAGIWRDAELVALDTIHFRQLFFYTERIQKDKASLRCFYELDASYEDRDADIEIQINGKCEDSGFSLKKKVYFKTGSFNFDIPSPKLWQPRGYGLPHLYDCQINISRNGAEAGGETVRIGIRTVELLRTETTDGKNGFFKFNINGKDIMCRGSNWVPLDAYHSRDEGRYARALALVRESNCNILRCWGGNVYEQHSFYDFCDENGIMVWQDFAMACGSFPQDADFLREIQAEAQSVVRKLRNHPSIILWAGDNECDVVLYSQGVNPGLNKITREILPEVIKNNDHGRPYLPSSPYVSGAVFHERAMERLSEDHLWGPRDYFKSAFYTNSKAHFISETGYHGCPSAESIRKFIDDEYIWPSDNKQWNLHSSDQKNSPYRVELMARQIKQLFGQIPEDMETFILASQISQAEAKKFFIERVRAQKPVKTGIIWWNLLDGWPQFSDAVVDYYFEKKLAFYYIKASQQPFCMMCGEIDAWQLPVYAVNDTSEPVSGRFSLSDGDTGQVLCEGPFEIGGNGIEKIGLVPVMYSEQRLLLIQWEIGGEKCFNHYICGTPPFSLDTYRKWLGTIQNKIGF